MDLFVNHMKINIHRYKLLYTLNIPLLVVHNHNASNDLILLPNA